MYHFWLLKFLSEYEKAFKFNGLFLVSAPKFTLITKLDAFKQVVDLENSYFYQATNQSSSVISKVSIISERGPNGTYN